LFCEANQDYSEFVAKRGVRITKNGRPCAALLPVTEETDLEALALAHTERFWRMFDAAIACGEKEGWTDLEELSD
jgi:antitoxin (DNA-binding transcriptional repressor) of toxin-antitoxin stability system